MEEPHLSEPAPSRWRRLLSVIGEYILKGLDEAGRSQHGQYGWLPLVMPLPPDLYDDEVAKFREQLEVPDVVGEMWRHATGD